jgi:hypothetical protein
MKTINQINADIIKLTMIIREKYPELSKYLAEMPLTIPSEINPEINSRMLHEYYNSLEMLLKKYTPNHQSKKKIKYIEK